MEARHSLSSTSILDDPMRQITMLQEATVSHQPPSQSSKTYTGGAPSGTGHGASGQSVTTLTEHVESNRDQPAFSHQPVLTPDQHDFSHAGGWATEPHADTFVIENDPILSPIHRAGADMNAANRENAASVGNENADEAVELLRASLHRKVPKE
ncbi:hypothetical protein TCE0_033f09569 [Talaromyces pinophilus]|uniref:Uncharacterized protein n=1 Tax=Talaromyces pinophilus TaxID=128442 RepID=A0A6V8HK33_TALPI|nr:hypothetical protein TCE0_033f09569 [Talaromyces pinophilus]